MVKYIEIKIKNGRYKNTQKVASNNGAGSAAQAHTSDQALGQINRDMEEKAAQERAKDLKLPYVDVGLFPINPDILHLVKEEDARKGGLMPFSKSGKNIRIAVTDSTKPETQEVLKILNLWDINRKFIWHPMSV